MIYLTQRLQVDGKQARPEALLFASSLWYIASEQGSLRYRDLFPLGKEDYENGERPVGTYSTCFACIKVGVQFSISSERNPG